MVKKSPGRIIFYDSTLSPCLQRSMPSCYRVLTAYNILIQANGTVLAICSPVCQRIATGHIPAGTSTYPTVTVRSQCTPPCHHLTIGYKGGPLKRHHHILIAHQHEHSHDMPHIAKTGKMVHGRTLDARRGRKPPASQSQPNIEQAADHDAQQKPPTAPASTSRETGSVPEYPDLTKSSDEEGKFL